MPKVLQLNSFALDSRTTHKRQPGVSDTAVLRHLGGTLACGTGAQCSMLESITAQSAVISTGGCFTGGLTCDPPGTHTPGLNRCLSKGEAGAKQ